MMTDKPGTPSPDKSAAEKSPLPPLSVRYSCNGSPYRQPIVWKQLQLEEERRQQREKLKDAQKTKILTMEFNHFQYDTHGRLSIHRKRRKIIKKRRFVRPLPQYLDRRLHVKTHFHVDAEAAGDPVLLNGLSYIDYGRWPDTDMRNQCAPLIRPESPKPSPLKRTSVDMNEYLRESKRREAARRVERRRQRRRAAGIVDDDDDDDDDDERWSEGDEEDDEDNEGEEEGEEGEEDFAGLTEEEIRSISKIRHLLLQAIEYCDEQSPPRAELADEEAADAPATTWTASPPRPASAAAAGSKPSRVTAHPATHHAAPHRQLVAQQRRSSPPTPTAASSGASSSVSPASYLIPVRPATAHPVGSGAAKAHATAGVTAYPFAAKHIAATTAPAAGPGAVPTERAAVAVSTAAAALPAYHDRRLSPMEIRHWKETMTLRDAESQLSPEQPAAPPAAAFTATQRNLSAAFDDAATAAVTAAVDAEATIGGGRSEALLPNLSNLTDGSGLAELDALLLRDALAAAAAAEAEAEAAAAATEEAAPQRNDDDDDDRSPSAAVGVTDEAAASQPPAAAEDADDAGAAPTAAPPAADAAVEATSPAIKTAAAALVGRLVDAARRSDAVRLSPRHATSHSPAATSPRGASQSLPPLEPRASADVSAALVATAAAATAAGLRYDHTAQGLASLVPLALGSTAVLTALRRVSASDDAAAAPSPVAGAATVPKATKSMAPLALGGQGFLAVLQAQKAALKKPPRDAPPPAATEATTPPRGSIGAEELAERRAAWAAFTGRMDRWQVPCVDDLAISDAAAGDGGADATPATWTSRLLGRGKFAAVYALQQPPQPQPSQQPPTGGPRGAVVVRVTLPTIFRASQRVSLPVTGAATLAAWKLAQYQTPLRVLPVHGAAASSDGAGDATAPVAVPPPVAVVREFEREVDTLQRLRSLAPLPLSGATDAAAVAAEEGRHHPLVRLVGYTQRPQLGLLLEHVAGPGDLFRVVQQALLPVEALRVERLNWLRLLCDVARGLALMHDTAQCLHRDVKPHNVLVRDTGVAGASRYRAVVADVGSAVHLSHSPRQWQEARSAAARAALAVTEAVGTHGYTAPEVLAGEGYSYPADVYSLGQLLRFVAEAVRQLDEATAAPAAAVATAAKGGDWLRVVADELVPAMLRPAPAAAEAAAQPPPPYRPTAREVLSALTALWEAASAAAAPAGPPLGDR